MLRYLANGYRQLSGRVPANWRPNWEFYAVIEGRCAPVFHDNDWPELQERTLWVFAPECRHGWIGESHRPYYRIALHCGSVPHPLDALVRANPQNCHAMTLNDEQVAKLKAIAAELEPHFSHPTLLSPLHLQGRLADLAVMILSGGDTAPPPDLSQLAVFKVESALSWYCDHLSRAPSVKEVAAAIHVSPSHLRRLFWQVRQASPKSVFQKTRLERAQELMSRCTLPLEEVARTCGFTGASHLCREYKAHYDVSPTFWRKKIALSFVKSENTGRPAAAASGSTALTARTRRAS
jgi:AraC family transcriptional regulator